MQDIVPQKLMTVLYVGQCPTKINTLCRTLSHWQKYSLPDNALSMHRGSHIMYNFNKHTWQLLHVPFLPTQQFSCWPPSAVEASLQRTWTQIKICNGEGEKERERERERERRERAYLCSMLESDVLCSCSEASNDDWSCSSCCCISARRLRNSRTVFSSPCITRT